MKIFRLSSALRRTHSNWKTFNFHFSIPQEFYRVFFPCLLFHSRLGLWREKINICWKIPLWYLIGSKSALDWRDLDHEIVEIFCVRFTSLLFMCSWNAAKKFHFFCSTGSTISPQSDVVKGKWRFSEKELRKKYINKSQRRHGRRERFARRRQRRNSIIGKICYEKQNRRDEGYRRTLSAEEQQTNERNTLAKNML